MPACLCMHERGAGLPLNIVHGTSSPCMSFDRPCQTRSIFDDERLSNIEPEIISVRKWVFRNELAENHPSSRACTITHITHHTYSLAYVTEVHMSYSTAFDEEGGRMAAVILDGVLHTCTGGTTKSPVHCLRLHIWSLFGWDHAFVH
jgi:hypothetical protein